MGNTSKLHIRKATVEDVNDIQDIFAYAKDYMIKTGNPNQWEGTYPDMEFILGDIKEGAMHVVEMDGQVSAVFSLFIGEEKDYNIMQSGAWRYDLPYGTIHRLASNGKIKGISKVCLDFCKDKIGYIRVDTHDDNKVMQHLLEKNGFITCGRILCSHSNTTRIAYDFYKD